MNEFYKDSHPHAHKYQEYIPEIENPNKVSSCQVARLFRTCVYLRKRCQRPWIGQAMQLSWFLAMNWPSYKILQMFLLTYLNIWKHIRKCETCDQIPMDNWLFHNFWLILYWISVSSPKVYTPIGRHQFSTAIFPVSGGGTFRRYWYINLRKFSLITF